jgi:hypothetical protein
MVVLNPPVGSKALQTLSWIPRICPLCKSMVKQTSGLWLADAEERSVETHMELFGGQVPLPRVCKTRKPLRRYRANFSSWPTAARNAVEHVVSM